MTRYLDDFGFHISGDLREDVPIFCHDHREYQKTCLENSRAIIT